MEIIFLYINLLLLNKQIYQKYYSKEPYPYALDLPYAAPI